MESQLKKMEEKIRVTKIEGIPEEHFKAFEDLGVDIDFHTQRPKNELNDKVIDYIIISTLTFPFDFVKDLLKDQSKILLLKLTAAIKALWDSVKSTKPALVQADKEPEYKQPKISLSFPVSKDEISTLEISNEVSDSLTEDALTKYFELLAQQIENRAEEEKLKAKVKLKIKSKRR